MNVLSEYELCSFSEDVRGKTKLSGERFRL